jgi:hypothetical protein
MTIFYIKSPSNKIICLWAETIYQAINKSFARDHYQYDLQDYFKLNANQVKKHESKYGK